MLISSLVIVIAFYSGMRYERYFLIKQFQRMATIVVKRYENYIGELKQELMFNNYPNSGSSNDRYKL